MFDGDLITQHSDALLAAFGPDGECDAAAFKAAAEASFDAKCGSALMMFWAQVLAATHPRTENPLQSHLDQLEGKVDDSVRDEVRRHGRVLVNTARVADNSALTDRWLTILNRLSDDGLSWLGWTMAAATAPVAAAMGGLTRFLMVLDVVEAAAHDLDVSFHDIRAIAATLAAVAAGDHDAGMRSLALPTPRSTLTILMALIPGLLRGRATALVVDQDGSPHGIADPTDPDVQRMNRVVAAAKADDRAGALAEVRAITGEPDDGWRLIWHLALSLGTKFGELFSSYERTSAK